MFKIDMALFRQGAQESGFDYYRERDMLLANYEELAAKAGDVAAQA
jgi:hypothetical protein